MHFINAGIRPIKLYYVNSMLFIIFKSYLATLKQHFKSYVNINVDIRFKMLRMGANQNWKKIWPRWLNMLGKPVYQGAEDVSNKPAERLICQDCCGPVG